MKRGEIRWYTFKAPDKRRPVMILMRSDIIPYLGEVTIAPITISNKKLEQVKNAVNFALNL